MAPKKKVIKKSALAPTVLIAGGAGFIGSHLAEALLEKDARVVVLDNFKTGKQIHINHLLNNQKFALYDVDINQGLPQEIESVDYIFHLAGLEEYLYSKENLNLESLLTNAIGTKNLLDLAQQSQAKFLLGSSIYVYQGMMSQLNLEKYFGHSSADENKYSLTEAKRYAEALVWEYFKKYGTNVRIARLPEVYGPRMDLGASGSLGGYLDDLLQRRNISIFGEGTQKEYYIYIADAISGLIKALLNARTEGKIYALVDKEPCTSLEVAFLVKGLADGPIDVQFKPKIHDTVPAYSLPDIANLAELSWDAKISLREGVIKTLKFFDYKVNEHSFKPSQLIQDKKALNVSKPKSESNLQPSVTENKLTNLTAINTISSLADFSPSASNSTSTIPTRLSAKVYVGLFAAVCVAFLFIFVGVPSAQLYWGLKSAKTEIQKVPTYLTQLDPNGAKDSSYKAFTSFTAAHNALQRLEWLFKLSQQIPLFNTANNFLSSVTGFSKVTYNLAKAIAPLDTIWEALRPNTSAQIKEDEYLEAKLALANAQDYLGLAQASYKHVNPDVVPEAFKGHLKKYQEGLDTVSAGISIFSPVMSEIPDLIGLEKTKKYVILFQNSNEIRPTGGFIGSYATLDVKDGKIEKLVIDDIYNPDGQIDLRNIKVSPPAPISEFLAEDKLHIRNANWDPDFPKSAQTIADLFYKITGESVDGVIALDLYFAKNLLQVTGPVFLTAYNEEISVDNLYERAQFHSEFNYKEGSDQKRSFLTILGSKILEKLFALPKGKMPDLLSQVYIGANQRHLLIHLIDSQLNVLLQKQKWNGSLVDVPGDYLYVVNANLGGTKANYLVQNAMTYEITSKTRDGVLRANLTLDYNHTGQDNAWPSGPYKDYVRVITKDGTRLTGAQLVVNDNKPEDIFKKILVTKSGKYDLFETSFVLNPKEKIKLVFSYDLPQSLSITKDHKLYSFYWQKQPGTNADPTTLLFDPPFGMTVEKVTPKIDWSTGFVKYESTLDTDKELQITLK